MAYESLLDEIHKEGIDIIQINFKGKSKGLYGDNTIAIDKKIDTSAEKKCILAEELGHHYTSYGNILDQSNINNIKQEKRARNWAYEKLVGIISLVNAFERGIRNKYELAEYLNITEDFLNEAINHYREKYGICCEIDNYLVYFEPHFGVLKIF
jgi:hypothetical protein